MSTFNNAAFQFLIGFGLTVDFTIEVVLRELHAVWTEANRLGRPLRQLRRREAEMRAAAIQWKAVIRGLRLPVGIWKVKDGHFHLAEKCFYCPHL